MKHRILTKATALFLAMTLLMGMIPASALEALAPEAAPPTADVVAPPTDEAAPPVDEATPPVDEAAPPVDEAAPPSDEEAPPTADALPSADPLAGGAYLATETTGDPTYQPHLNVRYLQASTLTELVVKDLDYANEQDGGFASTISSDGFRVEVGAHAPAGTTDRKVVITMPAFIDEYPPASQIEGVTSATLSGDSRTLTYTIEDGPEINFSVTITCRSSDEFRRSYPELELTPYLAYEATEGAKNIVVKVTDEAGKFTFRAVPDPEHLVTAYHEYDPIDPDTADRTSRYSLKNGNEQQYISVDDNVRWEDVPELASISTLATPTDPALVPVSRDWALTITKEGAGYRFTSNTSSIHYNVFLTHPDAQFDTQYGLRFSDIRFTPRYAAPGTTPQYVQADAPKTQFAILTTLPPLLPTIRYSGDPTGELYYNSNGDGEPTEGLQKPTNALFLDIGVFNTNWKHEIEPLQNPKIVITLPDGISQNSSLYLSRSHTTEALLPLEVQALDGTWSTRAWDETTLINCRLRTLTTTDGAPIKALRIDWADATTEFGTINSEINFYFTEAYAHKYWDGSAIADNDVRNSTVSATADNLSGVNALTAAITYHPYTPPVRADQVKLGEKRKRDYPSNGFYYEGLLVGTPESDKNKLLSCDVLTDRSARSYNGKIYLSNIGPTGDPNELFAHTNARFELKSEAGSRLRSVDFYSYPDAPQWAKNGTVEITLSSGETANAGATEQYAAPTGTYIESAVYTFPGVLPEIESAEADGTSYSMCFSYEHTLPFEGLKNPSQPIDYISCSFLGSDEQKPPAGQSAVRDYVVSRDMFVGKPSTDMVIPALSQMGSGSLHLSGPSGISSGERGTWTLNVSSISNEYSSDYKNKAAQTAVNDIFKASDGVTTMIIGRNFDYVKGSAVVNPSGVVTDIKWSPGEMSNGDGVLRIFHKGVYCPVDSVQFALKIDPFTSGANQVVCSNSYTGIDLRPIKAYVAANPTVDADGSGGLAKVVLKLDDPKFYYETTHFDVNGDGKQNTAADADFVIFMHNYNTNAKTTVNTVRQQGVFSYGASTEDNAEGAGPVYGKYGDTFTYRTFLLAQQGAALQDLFVYLPVPRAGVKPASAAAPNEWNMTLTGLSGKVIAALDTAASGAVADGKYRVYYSTHPTPTMQNDADVPNMYVQWNGTDAVAWDKATMIKVVASSLPPETADDIRLTFTGTGDAPPPGTHTNHIESYYRFTLRGKTYTGPTPSIEYILPQPSVSGTVYLDRDYSGSMTLSAYDQPIIHGATMELLSDAGAVVATSPVDENGRYLLVAPKKGTYRVRLAPNNPATATGITETTRLPLAKGSGSVLDPATLTGDPVTVGQNGVTGQNVGLYDTRTFTLHTDAAMTAGGEVAADTVINTVLGADSILYVKQLPGYAASTANLAPAVAVDLPNKLTAVMSASVLSLHGVLVTDANETAQLTATLADGSGGTVTRTFKARVLPPQVVAKFEDNMDFYAQVDYNVTELLGGISYLNGTVGGADITNGGITVQSMVAISADGNTHTPINVTDTKTFADGEIGRYRVTYTGTDAYARPIVDEHGNATLVRDLYVHGYPYLMQTSPLQRRVGEAFSVMHNQDDTYLTAKHKHVRANGDGWAMNANETFTSDPANGQAITLLGFHAYKTDGSDFVSGAFKAPAAGDVMLSSLPAAPGAYEVYYSVRMDTKSAILPLSRTLYQHGKPEIYIPSVITVKPAKTDNAPMDLDYAAAQVWSNQSLMMRDMAHVQEDGTLITYNWNSTKLYFTNGNEVTAAEVPNYNPQDPGSGNFVIAAPQAGIYGGSAANVFLKQDSTNVLKNTPGIYEMTLVFQDSIDGMGTAGAAGTWNENWASLYAQGGNGYLETKLKVVVTGDDTLPIMPDQDAVQTHFISTDSVDFQHLDALDDTTLAEAEALSPGIGEKIASRRVMRLDNGEDKIFYYEAVAAGGDTTLPQLFLQAMRFRVHDVDIHALSPASGNASLTETQYKDLHDAAVSMLWSGFTITRVSSPKLGEDGTDVLENPTDAELLALLDQIANSPNKALALELTLQVANLKITPNSAGAVDTDPTDGSYLNHGYEVRHDGQTVKETYKLYVHSDLAFERPNGDPLVTYGLHTPSSQPHTSMPLNAYFIGGKAQIKNSFPAASSRPDISTPGTAIDMDYSFTHPVPGILPTLREADTHYYGRAFVNGNVVLSHDSGAMPSVERANTGVPIDLASGFAATVDKWTNLPADTDPATMGKAYPPVVGMDGATVGAEFKQNQTANLKIYDSTNRHDPLYDSASGAGQPAQSYSSALPGAKTFVYVAEDLPTDANHPYHNGANRKELSVQYIFDSAVSLHFSANVKQVGGAHTLTLLRTATDDEVKALLGAYGSVVYGENPTLPVDLAANVAIVRGADGALPATVQVTTQDKNGRTASQSVKLVTQTPPVIQIAVRDEHAQNIPGVTIPNITNAVIGRPYTVMAPQVDGYVLKPGSESAKTIASVAEGVNKVVFEYVSVAPGAELTSYTVRYTMGGAAIMTDTRMGQVGSTASHTAPAVFYVGDTRYTLSPSETTNPKTITLVRPGTNELTFAYENGALPVPVGYSAQYTYNGAAVETTSNLGVVGKQVVLTAPAKFTKGTFEYTLKTGEPASRTLTLAADPLQNVARFAYDRTEIQTGGGGGGGGGGGTVTVNYYSVLFSAAPHGSLVGESVLQVKSGERPASVPKVTPAEGYTFLGWHTGDKTKLLDPTTVTITKATVFYAAFKAPDGTITDPGDGGGRPIPALERTNHMVYLLGDKNGNFRPDADISRAEVVTMFSRLLKKPMPENVQLTSRFRDVSADKWYASTVAYMEQFGIINGYEDGTFRPEAPIARSEFVAIASRFGQLELTDTQPFSDVPADHWAAVYINSSKNKGWIDGYEDGTFRPARTIARGETVKITNALLERAPDTAYISAHAAALAQFPDLPRTHWAYYEIMEAANAHDYSGKKPETWTKLK